MSDNLKITLDGDDRMELSLPITKVDAEKRLVSGFATLNNVDRHGDIVDADASSKAFERFRGNIREMHAPIAVGKMVSFEQKAYFDDESHKEYQGVFVEAYVSKGAEDTWQKVLDGTLSGFSIGARILDKDYVAGEDGELKSRIIKDYELFELSLVDSPANQFANVMSITKMDDGSIELTGDAFEKDAPVELTPEESGGAEATSVEPDASVMHKVLEKLSEISNKIGGNANMTKKDEVAEEATEVEVEEVVEKAAEVSEVEDNNTAAPEIDTDIIVKAVLDKVLERLESGEETTSAEVEETKVDVEETVNKAVSTLSDSISDIKTKLDEVTESLDSALNRVASLEDSTATRKSGELEGEVEEKSFWGGAFSKNDSVEGL